MADIFTQDVDCYANVEGTDMRVTDIEVSRSIGVTADQAKIKGVVQDIDTLNEFDTVSVVINDEVVFTGEILRATENEKGIVTIEAYDRFHEILTERVRININEPRQAYWILIDLLDDAGYEINLGPELDANDDVEIADQSEFAAGDVEITSGYGDGDRGTPLKSAIQDLLLKINGIIWIDRNNLIRITPYPDHLSYDLRNILEIDAGEDATDTERVVVKSGSPVGELGPAASNIYSQINTTAVAEGSGDSGEERTLSDNNIITQKGANSAAVGSLYRSGRNTNPGNVTVVGNTLIDTFDKVTIPRLESNTDISGDTTWTIKGVKHIVNPSNGYKTEIELSPEPHEILGEVSGPPALLSDRFIDKVEDGETEIANADVATPNTRNTIIGNVPPVGI